MQRSPYPQLLRFVVRHAAIGFGLATLFVASLVWFDPNGVGTLLLRASSAPAALLLLWFFLGLTLGSVQIAAAVMLFDDWFGSDPR
jgi:hypothetical protein